MSLSYALIAPPNFPPLLLLNVVLLMVTLFKKHSWTKIAPASNSACDYFVAAAAATARQSSISVPFSLCNSYYYLQ
jgi:hypothetical protein